MTQLSNLAFSFQYDGVIWKTSFDSFTGKMALEIRDPEHFKISYSILDLKDQTITATIKFDESDWWSSLSFYKNGILFIEKYKDTQSPLQKDLVVYDADKQQLIRIFSDYQLIEYKNGMLSMQNVVDPSNLKQERLREEAKELDEYDFIQPTFFPFDSPEFDLVQQYFDGQILELGCEYLEWNNYIIISHYVRSDKDFVRKLLVLKDEHEWINEIQDREVKGFAPGSFFVYEKYLVFINGKSRINAIEL